MMYLRRFLCAALVLGSLIPTLSFAQTVQSEDFTGATTNNDWHFFNGACLTAGTGTSTTNPGKVPGCATVRGTYYNQNLVGGFNGTAGTAETLPDPNNSGALRLTNGSFNGDGLGNNQSGAIVSDFSFPTSQGIQITFKTITYRGDSKGPGADGADGISFYLMDAAKPAGIGSFGGSLGYSCSNSNPPFDGLDGAFIGLGIDEYGNFLNGTSWMTGYTGPNSATGDNTALGYGYKPGRIGLRGAGNVKWTTLNAAYGTDPGSSTRPYYPASLATACPVGSTYNSTTLVCEVTCTAVAPNYSTAATTAASGVAQCGACPNSGATAGTTYSQSGDTCGKCAAGFTYNPTMNVCGQCAVGDYNNVNNQCEHVCAAAGSSYSAGTNQCIGICATGGTYNSGTNKCNNACLAPSGGNFWTYSTTQSKCERCPNGYTYRSSDNKCVNGATVISTGANQNATNPTATTAAWTTAAVTSGTVSANTPTYSGVTGVTGASTNRILAAVQNTCRNGKLYNYSNPFAPTDAGLAALTNPVNTGRILDYAPIPGAYTELSSLPTPLTIANESAVKRSQGTPIFYNLKITQDGLLSLSYSVSGAAYQSVIKNQDITAANGDVPANVRFGIAASTGGATNIHEIMCFKAAPSVQSGSSTSVNEKLAAKVQAGTQAFFAFYNQNNWTGALTANDLIDTAGVVSISATANWDASCVLTGTTAATGCATTGATGPTTAQGSSSRVILTCTGNCGGTSGNTGIPLSYASLSTTQQAALDAVDSLGLTRVDFLRGDRSKEINALGVGTFRSRDSVLSDIVDSSPIWVGPPSSPYAATWQDRLPPNPSGTPDTLGENAASQSYKQFIAANKTRLNVVYTGANDGMVHGFRSGSFDTSGNFVKTTTPNDGREVLAYMPDAVLQTIHNTASASLDFSSTQYGHNFYVDATPTADDLFYGGTWHTWLVGGLGAGGKAIYALDVTDPTNFSETNAASLVIGEWNPTTLTCATPGGATCGQNLGFTFGTPQIRRLHNGTWGVIFGNGFSSQTGDGGIYIMTVDPSTAAKTFYYLTTNTTTGSGNGIAYVSPADLDGDHITDYVYAGDLKGNVWRFDLTSTDPTNWGTTAPRLLFTTLTGQPITTKLQLVATAAATGGAPQLLIDFGTGQKTTLTNTTPDSYIGGTQSLYGIWDWDMTNWNSKSSVAYTGLTAAGTGLSSPYKIAKTNLQLQSFVASTTSPGSMSGTANAVCWVAPVGSCTTATDNNKLGWYSDLQVSGGLSEQVVFNPVFFQGAFLVNATTPANNVPTSCSVVQDTGLTYTLDAATGAIIPNAFPTYADLSLAGIATNATGTPYVVTTAEGTINIVYQTFSGTPAAKIINPPSNTKSKRLTWVELR